MAFSSRFVVNIIFFSFWLQNILKPSRPVYKISFQLSKIDSLYLKSGSPIFSLWTLVSETNNQEWVPCIRWPLLPSSGGSSYQTRWAQGKNSTKNRLKIFSTQEKTPQKLIYVKSFTSNLDLIQHNLLSIKQKFHGMTKSLNSLEQKLILSYIDSLKLFVNFEHMPISNVRGTVDFLRHFVNFSCF